MKRVYIFLSAFIFSGSAAQTFTEVASSRGVNTAGAKEGGLTWGDFNNDGCLDLLVNTTVGGTGTRLYQSNCNADPDMVSFTDVTTTLASGLDNLVLPRSVVWGDYNNDGYLDFARNTFNRIEIYLNKGPSASPAYSFGDASQNPNYIFDGSSLSCINTEGMGWADFNGDGWLDLIFENAGCGTEIYFKNTAADPCNAGFSFTDGGTIGLVNTGGNGDYSAIGDVNDDGWVDFLVREDNGENLFINDQDGTFTLNSNISENSNNGNKGGVLFCDFDNDGDFDIFWSDAPENLIFRNDGGSPVSFTRLANSSTGIISSNNVEGCSCGDVDHDGDVDLFLAAGSGTSHLYRNRLNEGLSFQFTQNNGSINLNADGEGAVLVDYDNDGDLDLYTNINGGNNQLWRSNLITTSTNESGRNYLKVRVVMQSSNSLPTVLNRNMIGATAILRRLPIDGGAIVGGIRDINGGNGHGSQSPPYMHFGLPLGPDLTYELTVKFPSINGIRRTIVGNVRPADFNDRMLTIALGAQEFSATACNTLVSLPLRLLSFSGKQRGEHIELNWKALNEDEQAAFLIEKSLDGKKFKQIGEVVSKTVAGIQNYIFKDESPFEGISYYRLKIQVINKESSYSTVISVSFGYGEELVVFPNPTNDKVEITVKGTTGKGFKVNLNNLSGKIIYSFTFLDNEKPFLPHPGKAGMYLVELIFRDKRILKKVVFE